MADVGHSRENKYDLTGGTMSRSAVTGSFALYDALYDLTVHQGERPQAVFVGGDVAYSGGSASVLNAFRDAIKRYSNGTISEDNIFPAIGNHDVHLNGCMNKVSKCFYGFKGARGALAELFGTWQMSYAEWKTNWFRAFPGMSRAVDLSSVAVDQWEAPTRYNINLDSSSSIYYIIGYYSGSLNLGRQADTPPAALEGSRKQNLHCRFLSDSLRKGKELGKSVFVYITHYLQDYCRDWSLLSQVDMWLTGHVHNYWQNVAPLSTIRQEQRHYPVYVLIGNGGFDQGLIDVVNFAQIKEEEYTASDGVQRVRVRFIVRDACISDQPICPLPAPMVGKCWMKCKDIRGGYDGGNGKRRATESKKRFGFTLDAPRFRQPVLTEAPYNGAYKLKLGNSWVGLKQVGKKKFASMPVSITYLVAVEESRAATFVFYDGNRDTNEARVAIDSWIGGPVVVSNWSKHLVQGYSFFDKPVHKIVYGKGLMKPSHGMLFKFDVQGTSLTILDVQWGALASEGGAALQRSTGSRLAMHAVKTELRQSIRS
eukprot:TRINITY_DN6976_c1_g1_i1.p1 TRINITY_DN6976_c1_g1~~TRINITY_DN6976_c1_g1_i1.p1  ORF type:complete len:585 (+),score=46.59 TRINITY_DN6976_c1_g1_i1:141-1757(+)